MGWLFVVQSLSSEGLFWTSGRAVPASHVHTQDRKKVEAKSRKESKRPDLVICIARQEFKD